MRRGGGQGLLGGSSQLTRTLIALIRIFSHARGDHRIQPSRNGGIDVAGFGRIQRQVPADLLFHAVARERQRPGQTLIKHTRQRIYIGAGISSAGGETLGSHIRPRAHHHPGTGQLGSRRVMSNTEIDQIHEVIASHQGIGRLDISMYQPHRMRGLQRSSQLRDHTHCPLWAHRPITRQQTMQIDPVDDRHHQIQLTIDFPRVINRDDVRLGQPGGGKCLTTKPFPITRLSAQLGGQHLDCHIATDHAVMGLIHLAHTALADQRDQPVPAKHHFIHRGLPLPHPRWQMLANNPPPRPTIQGWAAGPTADVVCLPKPRTRRRLCSP